MTTSDVITRYVLCIPCRHPVGDGGDWLPARSGMSYRRLDHRSWATVDEAMAAARAEPRPDLIVSSWPDDEGQDGSLALTACIACEYITAYWPAREGPAPPIKKASYTVPSLDFGDIVGFCDEHISWYSG